jgi:diadenosine tetraphosphatase ApaH/serine/threonine PP2A family protein phosphatase
VDFCLLGNHDAATIGAMDEAYYYDAARHVLRWTRDGLSEANYRWLYSLPYTRMEGEMAFFHSAPVMPSAFFYVVNTSEAQTHSQVFPKLRSLNFIGHAHLTTLFSLNSRKAKVAEAKQVALRDETKYILNVGSVGQPRDRDPRACYAIWDSEQELFQHVRVEYDIETAAGKVLSSGLDEKFAKRLYMGI